MPTLLLKLKGGFKRGILCWQLVTSFPRIMTKTLVIGYFYWSVVAVGPYLGFIEINLIVKNCTSHNGVYFYWSVLVVGPYLGFIEINLIVKNCTSHNGPIQYTSIAVNYHCNYWTSHQLIDNCN
jgi:hypothetical protein